MKNAITFSYKLCSKDLFFQSLTITFFIRILFSKDDFLTEFNYILKRNQHFSAYLLTKIRYGFSNTFCLIKSIQMPAANTIATTKTEYGISITESLNRRFLSYISRHIRAHSHFFPFFSVIPAIVFMRSSISIGFEICAFMPASSDFILSSAKALAVIAIMITS